MKRLVKGLFALLVMFSALGPTTTFGAETEVERGGTLIDENTPPPKNGAKAGSGKMRALNPCDNVLYPGEYADFATRGPNGGLDRYYFTNRGDNGAGIWNPVIGGWIPYGNIAWRYSDRSAFYVSGYGSYTDGRAHFKIFAVDAPSNSVLIPTATGRVWVFADYMIETTDAHSFKTCVR